VTTAINSKKGQELRKFGFIYLLIYIHLVCRLETFPLVDGGTYHLTVANYRMLIGWQMVFFGHD